MDFLKISGKTFLITGATGGIGSACCELLSENNALTIATGRNETKLKSLHTKENCKTVSADLTTTKDIDMLVDSIGKIDGLVHCSGIVKPMPVKFINNKHINEVFQTNLTSAIQLTGKLIKQKKFNQGSSLVYISSVSSEFPYLGGALYTASKAGLESYAKTVALEHSSLLRSNILSPGLVKTKILEQTEEATGKEEMEKYEKSYPLGFGDPMDVANACAFLLSDRSKWITGTNIKMDGGLTLGSK